MSKADKADPSRRALPPAWKQHDRVERPGRRQPHRVRLVPPLRPDRGGGGKFDFMFLAEGLRLPRAERPESTTWTWVGRPDTFNRPQPALPRRGDRPPRADPDHQPRRSTKPYEVARQFASLDHLSGGRAAWNVVHQLGRLHRGRTSGRGGLPCPGLTATSGRGTFLRTAGELWDSLGRAWRSSPTRPAAGS